MLAWTQFKIAGPSAIASGHKWSQRGFPFIERTRHQHLLRGWVNEFKHNPRQRGYHFHWDRLHSLCRCRLDFHHCYLRSFGSLDHSNEYNSPSADLFTIPIGLVLPKAEYGPFGMNVRKRYKLL